MNYLKTYELFGFGPKNTKTWEEKFNDIYNFYLKNKNKKDISVMDIPRADVKENDISISQGLDNHLVFYGQTGGNHNWELVDFSEADYEDPKSTKGVYKITPEIYEEYKKKVQEISDWLDKRSEESFGKSHSIISSNGEINLDFNEGDIELHEISNQIKNELKLVDREYEFEMSYHLWTSVSTNKLVVERRNLKIENLEIGFGGRFWCKLFTKDPFGETAEIWIESNSSHEYFDFDKHKWPYHQHKNDITRMYSIKKEMSRKEERDFKKNRKYPYAFSYDITPCSWESMELIKEITSLLEQMNSLRDN